MSGHHTGPVRRAISTVAMKSQTRLLTGQLSFPAATTAVLVVDAQRDLLGDAAPESDLLLDGPELV